MYNYNDYRYYLAHHGILGQKWGKRNGPPYPIGSGGHSASEKKAGWRKSLGGGRNEHLYDRNSNSETNKPKRGGIQLTEKQKKYAKYGAVACGVALTAVGGVYLAKTGKLQQIGKVATKNPAISSIQEKMPLLSRGSKSGNGKTKQMARDIAEQKPTSSPPNQQIFFIRGPDGKMFPYVKNLPNDLGGLTNPRGFKNNCKDVAEANIKRWLGVDPGAVAGEKTVTGNLHDFVRARGYNPKGVHWLGETGGITPDPSGDSSARVTKQLLKKFKEGDCGYIGVSWDPSRVIIPKGGEDGHAFNWLISGGKVIFYDDQPDPPITNAIDHLAKVNPNIEIEIVKITKEAFE